MGKKSFLGIPSLTGLCKEFTAMLLDSLLKSDKEC